MTASRKLTIATHGENEILFTRDFDAPRELVFEAMIRPELIQRWLLGPEGHTLPICEIDPRPGGKLRYVWRLPDGSEMGLSGVVREVQPPARIVHTEIFDQDWTGGEALVTIQLEDLGGTTRMHMYVAYSSTETRDMVLRSPMEEGIAVSYDRLDKILASAA